MARTNVADRMTLAQHLAEARRRFLISVAAVAALGTGSFFIYPQLLHLLQTPYCHASPGHCGFLVTNPLDGITLRFKISMFAGFLFSTPVILWQLWRFITPGLKSKERRYAVPFVVSSLVFFAAGVALAYFTFNHALAWLQAIGGKQLVTDYLSLIHI